MITFSSMPVQRPKIHLSVYLQESGCRLKHGSAAGMLKQILYCVRSPQRTPFAAYERPISAG